MQQMCRVTRWHRKTGKRDADYTGLSAKNADVVEIGAVARQPAGLQRPELAGRPGDRLLTLRHDQHRVTCGQHRVGCRNEVASVFPDHRDLDVTEDIGRQVVERLAGKLWSDRNLAHMKSLRLGRE